MFTRYPAIHPVDFRLDLLFDLGVIDGFVVGDEVPSVAKVFGPEKAYFT